MQTTTIDARATAWLKTLCETIGERPAGSPGNQRATAFFSEALTELGWEPEESWFPAMDWEEDGAHLSAGGAQFEVQPSPFSRGCDCNAPLIAAASIEELAALDARDKILLVHGSLAAEQLMPRGFVFYNPRHHQRTIAALEASGASALVTATSRDGATAGGVYPFPLIEDGDVDVPSVFMTDLEGERLLSKVGGSAVLQSRARRIDSRACNIKAVQGATGAPRIVLTAHIDAKQGTPGAIDNATGVVCLLLLADLLKNYNGKYKLEIVALNGEDHYAVPGQMHYIAENEGSFDDIALNINIDGAGYYKGGSAFSFFNFAPHQQAAVLAVLEHWNNIEEGEPWPQGDHSIFVQQGCPALAVTSSWFLENLAEQDITHTPKDNLGIVEPERLGEIAAALARSIETFSTV